MATDKQIEANRRNAQKSTGPVTQAGKAVARFNALKHGMTAETAVLPFEDPHAYATLREALITHYAPADIGEELLVDLITNSYWRLLRARRVETATMKLGIEALKKRHGLDPAPDRTDDDALAAFFTDEHDTMRKQERYHGTIERAYFRAVETLRKVQNDRIREERRSAADRNRNGFVPPVASRDAGKAIIVPVWPHPEDENQSPEPPNTNPAHLEGRDNASTRE